MAEVPGIHHERVSAFFRDHVPGGDLPLTFAIISGGRSNLTYRVHGGGHTWVLRRPPLGHVLATAHDMGREHRVLKALASTDVPVARPLAFCDDPAVNEAPFYVMEDRPGVVLANGIPERFAPTADDRWRVSQALVDVLVHLHTVDYRTVGLGSDFGRPDGYLERQVGRWLKQWEGNKTSDIPAIDDLSRRLRAALPTSPPATIVHGDYRLGNVALDPANPGTIVAVYDWEMATIGDPLADLGYTLIYWAEPGDPTIGGLPGVTAAPGFMTRAELIAAYGRASGRDIAAVDFYQVLALYKLAVISEGIYKRFVLGQMVGDDPTLRVTGALAERALAIADASGDARLRAR